MTQEEKAKSYDEALKRAVEFHKDTDRHLKATIERIFPELRESEDERIRKELIHAIDEGRVFDIDKEVADRWIAWLEKQKEQKPIKWTDLTWKDIVELECIINKVNYEFRNGIGQESFGNEVLEKFREYKGDEYLDEIEQKPENVNPRIECDKETDVQKAYREGRNEGIKMVREHPEEYRLQKPAEWSEEDEKKIKRLRSIVNDCAFRNNALDVNGDYCEGDYAELDDFLKSLRPSWKPSEEQMIALYNMIPFVKSECVPLEAVKPLESLYEDLKKL